MRTPADKSAQAHLEFVYYFRLQDQRPYQRLRQSTRNEKADLVQLTDIALLAPAPQLPPDPGPVLAAQLRLRRRTEATN